jgi:hypothetical protein
LPKRCRARASRSGTVGPRSLGARGENSLPSYIIYRGVFRAKSLQLFCESSIFLMESRPTSAIKSTQLSTTDRPRPKQTSSASIGLALNIQWARRWGGFIREAVPTSHARRARCVLSSDASARFIRAKERPQLRRQGLRDFLLSEAAMASPAPQALRGAPATWECGTYKSHQMRSCGLPDGQALDTHLRT